MDTEQLVTQWEQWREERLEALRKPHGWLTLESLEWVGAEPATLKNFPGLWNSYDHELRHDVTVTFTEEDQVRGEDGTLMVGTYDYSMPIGDEDITLTDKDGRKAEVASRYGKICVRVRNPQAPTRTNFTGTDTFEYDPEWVVEGPWRPEEDPWLIRVPSAQPAKTSTVTVQGEADILGQTVLVTGNPDNLQLIFYDATNGGATEMWRAAPVTTNDDGTLVSVDFNRSVNFPAHFTRFGTCPTPPANNRFQQEITAGEKKNR